MKAQPHFAWPGKHRVGVAFVLGWLVAALFLSRAEAALVGPGGYTNTFAAQPDAMDWSTTSLPGGSIFLTTAADLNAAVQAVSADAIAGQVVLDSGNPPAFATLAAWSSTGGYLVTRPTGNNATLLMCRLVNGLGADSSGIHIEYALTAAAPANEEVPAHLVYYSLSGNSNDWILIPDLSTNTPACCYVTNAVADVILASHWSNGSALYLLFADDNGNASPDVAYQIDNFSVRTTPSSNIGIVITNQPADVVVEAGSQAEFSVGAVGSSIRYQWYKNGAGILGATASNYKITSAKLNDAGQYLCVLSNALDIVPSRAAILTVMPDTTPPKLVSAISPLSGTSVRVTYSETVPNAARNTNYIITVSGTTNRLAITGLSSTSPSVTTIATAARVSGTSYTLSVTNVMDAAGNTIAPNTKTLIATEDTLLAFTNVWRLETNGIDQGTEWRSMPYNDSGWATGAGCFDGKNTGNRLQLAGQPIKTFLPLSSPSYPPPSDIPTYYFRTHFNFPGYTNAAVLRLRHLIDEGAVFFLNGIEMYRFNLDSAQLPFGYGASVLLGDAAIVGAVDLHVTNLLTGDNVLAVELHQGNATSSDITFGAEIVGHSELIPFGPVLITNQPTVLQVTESQPAVLGVEMVGALPRIFQWYSNDVAVPNATSQFFNIPVTSLMASGSVFRVAITNGLGGSVSSNILLSVLPDLEPPSVLSANASSNFDSVLVRFSERISAATATNISLYAITNQAGQNLQIFEATLVDAVTVRLLTAQPNASEQYILRVSGMQDLSRASNLMVPNAGVIIGRTFQLVNFDHTDETSLWRFYSVDMSDRPELDNAWKTCDYVEFMNPLEGWEEGYGLIGRLAGVVSLPAQLRTPAPMGGSGFVYALPCYYFRIKFNFRDSPVGARLQLRHIIDDGAVFYLNGLEFGRFNIGQGPVACATMASPVVDAAIVGPLTFSATNLVSGTNVLAVEVHQNGSASSDIVFGAELTAITASVVLTDHIPRLGILLTNGEARLNWTVPGYTLEQAVAAAGAWETVGGVVNTTFVTSATNAARFFRLKQ